MTKVFGARTPAWMRKVSVGALALTLASSAIGCGSDSCESERPDLCGGGGSGGGTGGGSILGPSPMSFSEANDPDNGDDATADDTGYTLEDVNGLEISGDFEAGTPTRDTYLLNTGAIGGATEPDFPGMDVRVFVDGDEIDGGGQGVSLSLDTVAEHGYSSLSGNYFINAAVFADEDYLLSITGSAAVAGKSYTIEVRGHVEEEESP